MPVTSTLYVIHGSHACHTATLMLDHKSIAYRRVVLRTGPHSINVRLRGFPGHSQPIRRLDEGDTPAPLKLMDRLGTVPALRYDDRRIQTNHDIARFLDDVEPAPPLFPADPDRRQAVEEAEQWGDEELQMVARRLGLAASLHGLDSLHDRGNSGRLGPLLAPGELARRGCARTAAVIFRANVNNEDELLAGVPGMLDRIDAWIADGVLDGEALNAADFTIAPSLALLAYRNDLRPVVESRPAGALMNRLLPEPL